MVGEVHRPETVPGDRTGSIRHQNTSASMARVLVEGVGIRPKAESCAGTGTVVTCDTALLQAF